MISVPDADRLLRAHAAPSGDAEVPLAAALGRILRERVAADRDEPPFDRVTMDGVAVSAAAVRAGRTSFRVASVQRAGEPAHTLPGPDACVEVMTGAVLPAGCDAVVPYERLRVADGVAEILDADGVQVGLSVHALGADARAGDVVVEVGTRLGPAHVGALAAVGRSVVRVAVLPRVAVLTTGDEVVPVDGPVLAHQIRRSNGPAIRAALAGRGVPDVPVVHAPDDAVALRDAAAALLGAHDVLVVVGGVSAGRFDLVPDVLKGLGVAEGFHRVRQRPGKPLWFGTSSDGRAVFGLPGNPVSALVCLCRYVLPFLDRAAGAAEPPPPALTLSAVPTRPAGFTLFLPVRREGLEAHAVRLNGSGDALGLVGSDGFVEVGPDVSASGPVPFFPWAG